MNYSGASAYDEPTFFEKYSNKRNQKDTPNESMEKPAFNELLGETRGKHILDLGCGNGLYGKELMEKGAESYHGIDGSENMLSLAIENLSEYDCKLERQNLEDFLFPTETYDLVISRLVFHYITDLLPVWKGIWRSLKSGGKLTFSVEHPVLLSCNDSYKEGKRATWLVDRYFHSGEREVEWLGTPVLKYHRTLEEYLNLVERAGFRFESLREAKPMKENFHDENEYERRMRIPLFLIMSLKKTS